MALSRITKSTLLTVIIVGVALLLIWAFMRGRLESTTEQEQELPIQSPSRLAINDGEQTITLDSAALEASGLVLRQMKEVRRRRRVRAFGTVLDAQELISLHDSITQAQFRLTDAQASASLADSEYYRAAALHRQPGEISDAEYESAFEKKQQDEADVRAAATELRSIQLQAAQKWGPVISSWLTDSSATLDLLTQRLDVLILATVQSEERITKAPSVATVITPEMTPLQIRLISPSPTVNADLQGLSYFYLAANRDHLFSSGMNVQVFLPVGDTLVGVEIPKSAVVWLEGNGWIYTQIMPGQFARKRIVTDIPLADGWFMPDSSLISKSVVVIGGQTLLSEEFRSQIQVGD
jgi:hypothetical protein